MYFHIPSQLGIQIKHSRLLLHTTGLPCSCVQLDCHAAVTIYSLLKHHIYKQLGCWVAMQLHTAGCHAAGCHVAFVCNKNSYSLLKYYRYKQLGYYVQTIIVATFQKYLASISLRCITAGLPCSRNSRLGYV